jgi:serine/threonine protein kinase
MGECWRVVEGADVIACKVVRPGDEARFDREVTAMSRLNSPRVAAVLRHDTMPVRADGTDRRYSLSDFIEGGDALVNVRVALSISPELRAFLDGTLEGLAELHAANVITATSSRRTSCSEAGTGPTPCSSTSDCLGCRT